jgi:hypothetical protein
MKCTGHKSNGEICGAWAIKGGSVCRVHGGSAPQVKDAARMRLLALVDPALAAMARELKRKTKAPNAAAIQAARDILDRAGLKQPDGEG